VNVKTTLPHVVGDANHVYKFVVWAEDSCYNRATGTVTITTYNGVCIMSSHRDCYHRNLYGDYVLCRVTGTVTMTTYNGVCIM